MLVESFVEMRRSQLSHLSHFMEFIQKTIIQSAEGLHDKTSLLLGDRRMLHRQS
jgi:hypothetical protein